MLNVDYLIVGQGVAGSCLALKLIQEKKSFVVIDDDSHKASTVAVGAYNALVLKRFALIWRAEEQIKLMHRYFGGFEKLLDKKFVVEMSTYRIFKNSEEITVWQKKAVLSKLKPYMSEQITTEQPDGIEAPYGYARVLQTGRINLENCLNSFKDYLIKQNQYLDKVFDYSKLKTDDSEISYQDIKAKKIVFCEGFGVKENPFFNYLPIIGVKGEVLKIRTDQALPKAIWKAYNFLMPVEDKICYTASTYDREDLTFEPTQKGEEEMKMYLEEMYKGDYEIIEHTAGIRPTVVDRRPIVGSHPVLKSVFVLNGMGTRGTLLAPQMTEFLYDYMENKIQIDNEADVRRFDKLFQPIS